MTASLRAARPPRVLYCSDTYPPQVNGVSVVTALSVSGLRDRGWECAVVAPRYPAGAPNPFPRNAEHALTTLPSAAMPLYPDLRLSAPGYPVVARALRDFAPDLVHCETEFVIGRMGQIAAARAGLSVVTSYHTDFGKYTEAYGAPWLRGVVDGYLRRFHRRALRVYTPSGPARATLLALGLRDVEVWGRGVDLETFHPARRSQVRRDMLGLDGCFTFAHVGRLAAEKGVERILEAFRIAAAALPAGRIRLVIAGVGPREEALRASAPPGVTFLGYLDRTKDLPALYASSDAFVFASLTETLGLVVLEAMASGLPVIAAPAGGVAEHLRDDVNGIAYPASNADAMAAAMVRLAMDDALARRLATGARATAEALSWSEELDRLDASYREVLLGAARARTTGNDSTWLGGALRNDLLVEIPRPDARD